MRFMGSVKDWSAAHERELKMKRQSDEFLNKIDKSDEIDESFLEDQDLVAALSNAEQDAGLAQPTPPVTPPEDLDDVLDTITKPTQSGLEGTRRVTCPGVLLGVGLDPTQSSNARHSHASRVAAAVTPSSTGVAINRCCKPGWASIM